MPFLEKSADIAVSGRHVADMLATFPAKLIGEAFNNQQGQDVAKEQCGEARAGGR